MAHYPQHRDGYKYCDIYDLLELVREGKRADIAVVLLLEKLVDKVAPPSRRGKGERDKTTGKFIAKP